MTPPSTTTPSLPSGLDGPASKTRYRSAFRPGLFEGQTVVVTGGGSGLGRCAAHELASLGAHVALVGRQAAKLEAVALEISTVYPERAGDVSTTVCDIRDEAAVKATVEAILQKHGRIDGLFNCAGGQFPAKLRDISLKGWDAVVRNNLHGTFLFSRECFVQWMEHHGGSIVNIASISGLRASTLRVAYGTSKAALIQLTKQQAVELGTVGIRANAIAPGPVETDMAKLVHSVAIRSDYHDVIPLNRYGLVEEIAAVAGFLCSQAAGYVNGQVLAVDGGFEAAGVGLPTLRRQAGA